MTNIAAVIVSHKGHHQRILERPRLRTDVAHMFHTNVALVHHFACHGLLKRFAYFDKTGQHGMNTVAVADMLRQQNFITTADSDDNARRNLRIITFTAVSAERGPFSFTDLHFMAAITTKLVRTIKFSQLHTATDQLK